MSASRPEDLDEVVLSARAGRQLHIGDTIALCVQRGGKTVFKQCTTEQAMAAKTTSRGAKLYVIQDPDATKSTRMMKAVKGEGLPRLRAPFENGTPPACTAVV